MPACPLYCSLASPLFSLLPSSCPFLSFLPVSFSLVSPLLCSCHMYLYLYVPHIVWCSPIVPVRLGMAHFSFHYDRRTFLRVYVPYFLCPFIWEWILRPVPNLGYCEHYRDKPGCAGVSVVCCLGSPVGILLGTAQLDHMALPFPVF